MGKASVLQVGKYFPPVRGGIETISKDLSDGLAQLDVRADVLCSSRSMSSSVEEQGPYSVFRAASIGQVLSTPISPLLPRTLRRLAAGYNVIHVHHPNPLAAAALYLARLSQRIVVHWHSDVVRQKIAYLAFEHLQEWMLRRADAIIATSPPYLDTSPSLGRHLAKARVIPYGISPDRLTSRADLVENIRRSVDGRKLVFGLGRLVYYKGFETLIEAAAMLPEDCAVIIGGDGPLRPHLDARIQSLGLAHRVRLVGDISEKDLGSYYDAADVFCLSSVERSEAFGLVQLEAMQFGKPVVATKIPGSGVGWVNLTGVTGINVAPGSAPELARAVKQLLLDDGLRRDLGSKARERVNSEFTRARMAERVKDLYTRLLHA
jgi:rhamnosyl/mannosyltransferase